MYYSIAGHVIQITGEEPGCNIPGFSSFVLKGISFNPVLCIRLNENILKKGATLIYQFTIEKGTCSFLKYKDCYSVRWKQLNGAIWLMEIQPQNEGNIAYTNMNVETDPHIFSFSVWIAFGIIALYRKTVGVHASAVIHNGSSIFFLGESGTGKSTQSELWLRHIPNTELLNDDSPFIRFENEIPIAWGSPWSGKIPCYKNKNTSISAFIRLRQAAHNSIRRLRTIEAIGALQPSLPPIFASEPTLFELMLECLSSILCQIPVYILDCLPNDEAVDMVYSTLKKDGRL